MAAKKLMTFNIKVTNFTFFKIIEMVARMTTRGKPPNNSNAGVR